MQYIHKLKEYRLQSKYSQKEIAEILQITQQQYSLYEKQQRDMPIYFYAKLAKLYSTTIDDLIELTDKEQ